MLTLHSFLQTACRYVKALATRVTKRLYRTAAVMTTVLSVVMVITLTSSGFGGGGKSAIPVFAETIPGEEAPEDAEVPEETELVTEAKIQIGLTDLRTDGQMLVGDLLAKDEKEKQEQRESILAEMEQINREKRTAAEARAKALAEEERAAKEAAQREAAVIPYSEGDYQVLLKIVQAEAGICDEKGKILVANVILNRVRNKEFPGTITDVVYQRSQFSPVSNGSINRVKVSQETIDCVNRALAGEDYSQGALYFMYRGGSKARAVSWFDSRLTFLFQHEAHEFFR